MWGSLLWAVDQLERGASTGVRGAGRLGSAGTNAKSASRNGHLLSDSLADWVRLQLIAGPYDPSEIPWLSIKISPLGLQVKPSGAGRVLVDMSFPWRDGKEVNIEGDIPISPNDGIDLKEFPTSMDGTPRVLKLLTTWGPGCFMTKAGDDNEFCHYDFCNDLCYPLKTGLMLTSMSMSQRMTSTSRSYPGGASCLWTDH